MSEEQGIELLPLENSNENGYLKILSFLTLTDKQNKEKNKAVKYYKDFLRGKTSKPCFCIAGISGSGKSTIISHIIKDLGLDVKRVAFVAYTGMASSVLVRKGLPAMTCHRLIYIPMEITEGNKKKIIFKLKETEELEDKYDLIVIDEMSMVDEKMMDEFESFKIPIIGTGDWFQLKPVAGKMNKYILNPDGFLDEPVRQALESPIIYIANQLRQSRLPSLGTYGDTVRVFSKDNFDIDLLGENDQILVGRNNTSRDLNKLYRKKFLNKSSLLPEVGDTLMCLRNNWTEFIDEDNIDVSLVNGLQCIVENIRFYNDNKTFKADLRPTFFENNKFVEILGDSTLFKNPACKDENYIQDNYPDIYRSRMNLYFKEIKINKFDYGNVITTYKSQGSEWDSVTYFDEYLNKDIYFNHFYTGVTRARNKLDIVL